MAIQCDICGGSLVVCAGGESAKCQACGMVHSVERVREMLAQKRTLAMHETVQPVAQDRGSAREQTPDPRAVTARLPLQEMAAVAQRARSPKYRQIAALTYKLGQIIEANFPDYEVEYMVPVERLRPRVTQAIPVHFLFKKNGIPLVAVITVTTGGYQTARVQATWDACVAAGVRPLRFFCNDPEEFPNEPQYVCNRIRAALNAIQAKNPRQRRW